MNTKKIAITAASLAVMASMATAIPASAQTANVQAQAGGQWQTGQHGQMGGRGRIGAPGMMKPGVAGKVTAISGSSITLSGRQGFGSTSATVDFSVDASSATVMKDNATSSISSIAVGDMLFVQGTVNGTNVTATMIRDGMMGGMRGAPREGKGSGGMMGTGTPAFVSNGEPIVAGKISAINNSSLTVTTASNVTYTVDASNAKIVAGKDPATLSNLAIGDTVLIQGAVSGTSVTASTVIDQANKNQNSGTESPSNPSEPSHGGGIFGGIGSFFMHLFGF